MPLESYDRTGAPANYSEMPRFPAFDIKLPNLDFGSVQSISSKSANAKLMEEGVLPPCPLEGIKSVPEKMPPKLALPPQGVEAAGNVLTDVLKNVPKAQEQEGGLLSKLLSEQPKPPKCDKPVSSAYEGLDGDFQIKYCGKPTSSTLGIDASKGDFIPPLPSDPNYNDHDAVRGKNCEPESLEPKTQEPEYEPPLREKYWLETPKKQ